MKTLNRFITEKLKITKNTKLYYFPETIQELRKIVEEQLAKDKNADLNNIDISKLDSLCDTSLGDFKDLGLFEGLDPHNIDISNWDVSNIKDMHRMFFGCKNFTCKGLDKWDVSNCKTLSNMFYKCEKITGKELENWDVSNCENLFGVFVHCKNLDCDLSNWNLSNCNIIAHMFNGCEKFNCNLESWGKYIPYIDEKYWVFEGCTTLKKNKLIPSWYK